MKTTWRFPVLAATALLVLLTVAAYLPALKAGFIWDDDVLITQNRMVKASDGLYRFWLTTEATDYYPMTGSLCWLEWRLWDGRATGYHVVNVLLHAVNAVLAWLILRRLKVPGAWLAAAVFAIHPVNVATVAWVSEQKNTLSMLFYALSILLYLRFDESISAEAGPKAVVGTRWCAATDGRAAARPYPTDAGRRIASILMYILSLFAFVLALLAKTAVVMLPVVLLGCVWWRHGRVNWKHWLCSVPYFVSSLILAIVTIVQHREALGKIVVQAGGFGVRLAGAGWAVWFYLSKALLPVGLTVIYPKWGIDASRWVSYVPGMVAIGGLALFWWKRGTWGRPLLFGLGYFVVMLFPVLGFFDQAFYRYSLVADHWQYYSIIGVIALVVAGGQQICSRGAAPVLSREASARHSDQPHAGRAAWLQKPALLGAGLLLVLGVATWRRSRMYADSKTLWRDNAIKCPGAWPRDHLGLALLEAGRLEDAVGEFEQALRLDPGFAQGHFDLGVAWGTAGNFPEAIRHYEQALRLQPRFAEAHSNLGAVLTRAGRIDEAIEHFERAIQINPDLADAHNNLGVALDRLGRVGEAIEQFEVAVRLKPDFAKARNNLGDALLRQGRVQEAIGQYEQVARLRPGDAAVLNNLGTALWRTGRFREAVKCYEQALRINPGNPEAHYNLGGALEQAGRLPEAIAHYEEALRLNPGLSEARDRLERLRTQR
jgi:tetratricopeptide (TPR) repeat protein